MSRPDLPRPSQLFFSTPAQRAALARERFFEEGENPAGLVNDAVLQSWARCNSSGKRTRDRIAAEPVSTLRLQAALRHSRHLREAAAPSLSRLEMALAGTACQIMLTNADGMIICVGQRSVSPEDHILPGLARVGMDLSEDTMGTTAPGIVSATGKGCCVLANEHFNDAILRVHCAAAPILNADSRLAGVLDLSVEGQGFGFDAAALISSYAADIENRLLQMQSPDLLVLRFHADPFLLGTPMAGLAGINDDGLLDWINGSGSRLTGGRKGIAAEGIFGLSLTELVGYLHLGQPGTLRMPNGLTVWLQATLGSDEAKGPVVSAGALRFGSFANQGRNADGEAVGVTCLTLDASAAPSMPTTTADSLTTELPNTIPAPLTLHETQADRIDRALQETHGNVTRAASHLGVSRGLIYRHLTRSASTLTTDGSLPART